MSALQVIVCIAEAIALDVAFTGRRVGVGFDERQLEQGRAFLRTHAIDALVMAYQTDAGVLVFREVRAGDVVSLECIDALISRVMPGALELGCGGMPS